MQHSLRKNLQKSKPIALKALLLLAALLVMWLYLYMAGLASAKPSLGINNPSQTFAAFPTTVTKTQTSENYAILKRFSLGFEQVSAGGAHTCAIANGQAYCWGRNNYGQLGNGTTTDSLVPVLISGGSLVGKTVTSISAGMDHTCAIANGQAHCWGPNDSGEIGDSTKAPRLLPVAVTATGSSVLASKTVTSISAGMDHTCAIANGQAYCWGRNNYGQLGDGTTTDSLAPVLISGGSLAGKIVTSISAGIDHTCAVANSKAHCWGYNLGGQLGDGTTSNKLSPVAVKASSTGDVLYDKTVTGISAGMDYTCAIANGQAYCWGRNNLGQLGNGTTTNSSVPVAVQASATSDVLYDKTVTSISTGGHFSCAIANGQAYCWGFNDDGTATLSSVPVAVNLGSLLGGKTVTSISVSISVGDQHHVCASIDGRAYCWGENGYGQFGNSTSSTPSVTTPSTPNRVYDKL